ncbi:MAG: glycosyltransferase family 2 protein [Patescibacteria group bacterium]|jgi:glycosyltransferase involved in cell wall biosynthesis|nr:glycosyltransferase family 2 protein [Patescibacteria group bacterium]
MNKFITILLPCLNEEKAIPHCLTEINKLKKDRNLNFELLVVDNGSSDSSVKLLEEWKDKIKEIRVLKEERRGYGFAYLKGLKEAKGEYIYMSDLDGSYDFSELLSFEKEFEKGSDLVIGNRFSGKMSKKSMTFLHRFIGNPILSRLVRAFFKVKVKDIHCGARAISKKALDKLDLRTGGMEFASEMIIKASRANLNISEVKVSYNKRIGKSKLQSFRDGWRHLRFILLYSPSFLFILPGLITFFIGLIGFILFYFFDPVIFGITFMWHPLFVFSALILIGYQLLIFGSFSKIYAINHLGDYSETFSKLFKMLKIEKVAPISFLVMLIGVSIFVFVFIKWLQSGFGDINQVENMLLALTISVISVETFFSAFMFSVLSIKNKN